MTSHTVAAHRPPWGQGRSASRHPRRAAGMWTVLVSCPKVFAHTHLVWPRARRRPLRASFARAWVKNVCPASPVSAAKPTINGVLLIPWTAPARPGHAGVRTQLDRGRRRSVALPSGTPSCAGVVCVAASPE
jgi:hypothetical protein